MPTVLVADDDADHRELLTFALTRAGHRVIPVGDAGAAMTELLSRDVDAALLDVRMPGESGIELCRRLRAEPDTALLPVMLISADVSDDRILTALYAGADDFVPKPFHRAELCARLDNLLLRRSSVGLRPAQAATAALLAARNAVPRTLAAPISTVRPDVARRTA
ncbi:response regulator transcription factor [Actinoplanes sp. M2I2]|uniref:response regulator transcription factor n=1 Tax=Actinoplanes sp. M2I2 TaxID=1734444 RepID=UPI0020208227|nr:response regulator transcription factor [Actinoplanes sp. M2I2]